VAEASWGQPAVGLRGGVGYEPLTVASGNLRAVGFTDLRARSAFLEERWLTGDMAAGRTTVSGIHASAAEVRLLGNSGAAACVLAAVAFGW
jgi:hypothetical protein